MDILRSGECRERQQCSNSEAAGRGRSSTAGDAGNERHVEVKPWTNYVRSLRSTRDSKRGHRLCRPDRLHKARFNSVWFINVLITPYYGSSLCQQEISSRANVRHIRPLLNPVARHEGIRAPRANRENATTRATA